jgi:carboxy-terminal domain RNA polymerase II polypeptide A small phosphatase
MISFTDDSREIKDLLSEIPKCKVNEFKGEQEHESSPIPTLTEPNDSPFRVRRLSRSFSIPNAIKTNNIEAEESEILLSSSHDENKELENMPKSKFILLKRSRSLGHIFLPNLPNDNKGNIDEKVATEVPEDANSLTEKVEALEIEVLPAVQSTAESEKARRVVPLIDRPQTSPPILSTFKSSNDKSTEEPINKLSILDRMQKSLGFFFRCARNDDDSNEEEYMKYPMRSRTPDAKFEKRCKEKKAVVVKMEVATRDVPMQAVNFITKVDEPNSTSTASTTTAITSKFSEAVKKIPAFYDVSGPKGPLLQPQCSLNEGRKCLVLDLDETLVHSSFHIPEAHDLIVTLGLPDGSQQNIYVAKRPGVDEFLARMSELFEVVIFTASLAHYADPVIDFLARGMNKHLNEPKEIKLRLYRESCLFLRGLYVKDLSRLGRKLEHTVIVDNSPASFLLQPEHGIPIKSWFSDTGDRELDALHESLLHFVDSESVAEWKSKLSAV